MTSTIKVDNIQNQNGETFNIVSWDTTAKTSAFTAVSGKGYFVNTTSTAITATLPASPLAGDTITFSDYTGTFQINNLTIDRNGSNIRGSASNFTLNKENQTITLVYVDATEGWNITQESNNTTNFLEATGGTTTICGDFRIHTFTGPGTFCVSSLAVCSSNNEVDYLVVAGGGGGGGGSGTQPSGGGGAGGYRASGFGPSPLQGTALTVTATAFPITVGGGGAERTNGANSIFSTITSAGGGLGGKRNEPNQAGGPGGSGGGGGATNPGGTGNTPPVSPPQGNNGGAGDQSSTYYTGGGGGGASAVGTNSSSSAGSAGNGGDGSPNSITGSAVFYAGGGGGVSNNACNTGGLAGNGGGGVGFMPGRANTGGTDNTGGGGGAGPLCYPGTGGSGIVIIRYKYQ